MGFEAADPNVLCRRVYVNISVDIHGLLFDEGKVIFTSFFEADMKPDQLHWDGCVLVIENWIPKRGHSIFLG